MEDYSQFLCTLCSLGEARQARTICLCMNKLSLVCSEPACIAKHFSNPRPDHCQYSIEVLNKVSNDRESIKAFKKKAKRVHKASESLEWNLEEISKFKEDFRRAIDELHSCVENLIVEIEKKLVEIERNIQEKRYDVNKSIYEDNWVSEFLEENSSKSAKQLAKKFKFVETKLKINKILNPFAVWQISA